MKRRFVWETRLERRSSGIIDTTITTTLVTIVSYRSEPHKILPLKELIEILYYLSYCKTSIHLFEWLYFTKLKVR